MKIERYILLHFSKLQEPRSTYQLLVPKGARFLGLKALPDGIYGWYAISEIITGSEDTDVEEFVIVLPGKSIPDDSTFIAILDTIVETSNRENPEIFEQGIIVFPIFKLNKID